MPLLLRGLNLPDNEIRAGVIDTLLATTDPNGKDNELVSRYASSLVTAVLKNAKAKDMPSPVCKGRCCW
jgi:DNA repair/transcription protein MET18/MMS19